MVEDFNVDASELHKLAADLGTVPATAGPFIHSAVKVTSLRVKNSWRSGTSGIRGAPALPYAIGFDIFTDASQTGSVIVSEIGPDKEKNQGALGNLVEFEGDKSGGLDSHEGVGEASLERNEADFEKGLSIALRDAERKANL